MKQERYFPGQPIREEDLNWAKYTTQDAIEERLIDLMSPGVIYDSQLNAELSPFLVTVASGLYVNVGSGVAISAGTVESDDASQPGGNRILIPAADVAAGKTYTRSYGSGPGTGTGTGPFLESPDGLGDWVATPQSTLTQFVPVVDNSTNYIWLGYLGTVNTDFYSLHKATSAKIYPQGMDGYDIVVTQTNVPPTLSGNNNYILIATAVTSGGNISLITQNPNESYATTRPNRVSGNIDCTSPTADYGDGTNTFDGKVWLDQHTNALGTGTLGVTPENPHRQKIVDLEGIDDILNFTIVHQKEQHSQGIVGTSTTLNLIERDGVSIGGSGAVLQVAKPISGEATFMSGIMNTTITPVDVPTLGGDGYVPFYNSDPAGTYNIYLQNATGSALLHKLINSSPQPTNTILIATVRWNYLAGGELDQLVDVRAASIGSISYKDIQPSAVLSTNLALADGTSAQVTTTGSGIKTAHIQNGAIATAHFATGAVDPAALASLAVTSPKIALADNTNHGGGFQCTTEGLGIKTTHIQNAAITASLIDIGAVGSAAMAAVSVTSPKLALADNADHGGGFQCTTEGLGIKTTHIADGAVTAAKLGTDVPFGILSSIWNGLLSTLSVIVTSTATVEVKADSVSIKGVVLSNVDVNASTVGGTGAGYLDSGIVTQNTWYAVHLIANALNTLPVQALLSLSATAPTLPAGYTLFRRVGWVSTENDANAHLLSTYRYGDKVTYFDPALYSQSVNSGGVTKQFATYIPPTSRIGRFAITGNVGVPGVQSSTVRVRTTGASAYVVVAIDYNIEAEHADLTMTAAAAQVEWLVDASRQLDIGVTTSGSTVYVTGYIDPV